MIGVVNVVVVVAGVVVNECLNEGYIVVDNIAAVAAVAADVGKFDDVVGIEVYFVPGIVDIVAAVGVLAFLPSYCSVETGIDDGIGVAEYDGYTVVAVDVSSFAVDCATAAAVADVASVVDGSL